MYPANHYMDPYHSHYRNHTPYPYYPPTCCEASHPRPVDSSFRPPNYGSWPYNTGMHHPHPPEYHCCCNHTYSPGYYGFRHPFPQELPPPHLYYHGPFTQHPNSCPSYVMPQHIYPVDQSPYGYDKFKSHCCGCPNHVCHGAEKSSVKIEEERPDVKPESEQKDADSANIIRHPSNQHPFVWLPSSNMEGKENYALTPQLLNGWVPVSSKGTRNVKQQEQDSHKEKQFQWPIVWMPAGYDEPKQKAQELKEMDEGPKASEGTPQSPKVKIIPLSWFENGHHNQRPVAKDGSGDYSDRSAVKSQPTSTDEHKDGTTVHKTTPVVPKIVNDERKHARENYKTIPVVPEKEIDEKKVGTCRTIPVMADRGSDEKKTVTSEKKEVKKVSDAEKEGGNGKTKQNETSTAKHSKLPPVCLRVDPLPRKKSGNGSSRSPSPPTRKDSDKTKKDIKEAQSHNLEPKQSETKKYIPLTEVKGKNPDEINKGVGFTNQTVQAASAEHSQKGEVPKSKDDQKVQAGSTTINTQENAGLKNSQGGATNENAGSESLKVCNKSEEGRITENEAAKDDAKTCRTTLSESDAAICIQSAYRGYDVRRWQPLDKLRKIRGVRDQMQGIRKQLECLEASSKKLTEKEHVAIGESIMNLLLKLDTIQGLHPSVREARKSVARELICLQEKLDTLCKQPSGDSNHIDSKEEKQERTESLIQTPASTLTAEASDKDKAVRQDKDKAPSSVDSMELCDRVPSGVPIEVRQDADAHERENKRQDMELIHEEGKATEKVELRGISSVNMMSDATLPEHSSGKQENQIEESNAFSMEEVSDEDKAAVEGEGEEAPPVDSMKPLHDLALLGDSSALKQHIACPEQNIHVESNTGVPPAAAEDPNSTTVAESVGSGAAAEMDALVEDQEQGTAALESMELEHDAPPSKADQQKESSAAEEDQQKELDGPVDHLKDPSTSSNYEERDDRAPADDFAMLNAEDQPEGQDSTKEPDGRPEASPSDIELAPANAEEPDQAALSHAEDQPEGQDSTKEPDGTPEASPDDIEISPANAEEPYQAALLEAEDQPEGQDSTKEPDGTSEASPNDIELSPANAEEPDQAALLEAEDQPEGQDSTKDPDGTSEASPNDIELSPANAEEPDQAALELQDEAVQYEASGKDSPHLETGNKPSADKLAGESAGEDPLLEASREEPEIQESLPNLAEEADDTRAEIIPPGSDTSGVSCAHEGAITGHERPEMKVSPESKTDAQEECVCSDGLQADVRETDDSNETPKEAPEGPIEANSAEEHVQLSETDECNEHSTGACSTEEEADNLREDIAVQTEAKAPEEALDASDAHECTETQKDAAVHATGVNSVEEAADGPKEDVDVQTEDTPVCTTEVNSLEEAADGPKEDVAVQTEAKVPGEALSAAATTPDDSLKDGDEKKLAEENQKLRELLQKLLASGNDQMGVITDLSEKVKALERKLQARKKRPKVRVHRPSRHAATAKVH